MREMKITGVVWLTLTLMLGCTKAPQSEGATELHSSAG